MRILSPSGLWSLCACTALTFAALPSLTPQARAQDGATAKAPKKKRVVKRDRKKIKSVRHCMDFSQRLGADEESVELQLESGCKFDVMCSLEWDLTCTNDDGSKTSTPQKHSSSLEFTDAWNLSASAAMCEADWELADVKWNCVAVE